jgi:hypothetical protein
MFRFRFDLAVLMMMLLFPDFWEEDDGADLHLTKSLSPVLEGVVNTTDRSDVETMMDGSVGWR